MRLRYIFLLLLAAAILAGIAVYAWMQESLKLPGPLEESRIVYIKPGSSTAGIAADLLIEGVIDSPFLFSFGAKQEPGALKFGEYEVPAHASLAEVLGLLKSGRTYQRRLTFAEGLTSAEIVEIINGAEVMTGLIETAPPEGALLPETYNYTRNEDRAALLARMQKGMRKALDELWPQRGEDILVKSPEEAVTLASIVEKETGIAGERARVAGVFYNRLKIGMPLQSDPTVIYALTEGKARLGRFLLRADLNHVSPYNTYLNAGLPPGPIANPGRAALEAVLHPEKHDYLYFVADGSGGHSFARSLTDHNDNVSKWREVQKKAQ
jgi:UPF0755 protein